MLSNVVIRKEIHFNPLSLYRERLCHYEPPAFMLYISIHSPYTGRDDDLYKKENWIKAFQSTLPIQGETGAYRTGVLIMGISIHSPYTGRDYVSDR